MGGIVKLFISMHITIIQKVQNTCQIACKYSNEANVVIIVFKGFICDLSSFCPPTWIRNQKFLIKFTWPPLLVLKITQLKGKRGHLHMKYLLNYRLSTESYCLLTYKIVMIDPLIVVIWGIFMTRTRLLLNATLEAVSRCLLRVRLRTSICYVLCIWIDYT